VDGVLIMKISELIVKLGEYDPNLTVCLNDWNENYREPFECTKVEIHEGPCSLKNIDETGYKTFRLEADGSFLVLDAE
jgi:hypothetical protein